MPVQPPAHTGDPVSAIDTPAMVVDLDAYERNLDLMAAYVGSAGVVLRPHAKTHKSPVVALDQIARGAVGQCCQKVSEAEVLVDGGVSDVLVSNEIVGDAKVARLAALAARARIAVCADDAQQVAAYAKAARAGNVVLHVLVEIDAGAARCGVAAGGAVVALAQLIGAQNGLEFAGLQAYHGGAQHLRTPDERSAAIAQAGEKGQDEPCRVAGCRYRMPGGDRRRNRDVYRGGQFRDLDRTAGRVILLHGRRLRPQPGGGRQQRPAIRACPVHRRAR